MPLAAAPSPADLVEEHLDLVDEAVRRIGRRLPAHVDRDDLVGAGHVALVQAAGHYDPDRGPFAAFAARRLSGAMLDELRRGDWATRAVRHESRRHRAGVEELSARLGRTPTRAEVASEVGLTRTELARHEADHAQGSVASLEALLELGTDPQGAATAPVDALLETERRTLVRRALAALPPRTCTAVTGRYFEERSMRDLADELGVSESRVSQLCTQGVATVRATLAPYLQ